MHHPVIAKLALTGLCGAQGLGGLLIDLNRTHATNPFWARHARFHVVWQSFEVALMSAVEIWLIWARWVAQPQGFYLALILSCMSPLAFLLAFLVRRCFGAALSDENGVKPVTIQLFNVSAQVDMNLVLILFALATEAVIFIMY